jgi:hypothetical protein
VASVSPGPSHALIQNELDPGRETDTVLGDRDHLRRAFASAGLTSARIAEPLDH